MPRASARARLTGSAPVFAPARQGIRARAACAEGRMRVVAGVPAGGAAQRLVECVWLLCASARLRACGQVLNVFFAVELVFTGEGGGGERMGEGGGDGRVRREEQVSYLPRPAKEGETRGASENARGGGEGVCARCVHARGELSLSLSLSPSLPPSLPPSLAPSLSLSFLLPPSLSLSFLPLPPSPSLSLGDARCLPLHLSRSPSLNKHPVAHIPLVLDQLH